MAPATRGLAKFSVESLTALDCTAATAALGPQQTEWICSTAASTETGASMAALFPTFAEPGQNLIWCASGKHKQLLPAMCFIFRGQNFITVMLRCYTAEENANRACGIIIITLLLFDSCFSQPRGRVRSCVCLGGGVTCPRCSTLSRKAC